MFTKASLRLTAWYVAILMTLSLVFSVWLYAGAMAEVRVGLNEQLLRPFVNVVSEIDLKNYLNKHYNDSHARVLGSLFLLNIGVFVVGGFASYFLARRTLQPIEEALEAQNRFTADASHELRTPLTAMKTEIEVALRNATLPVKETRELLKSSVEEIDRLSKLTDGLLVLARSGDSPELVPVQLETVAASVVKRFNFAAKHKNMIIEQQLAKLIVRGDEAHINTILGILLDNAIKYGAKNSQIIVNVALHDGQACATIYNQGKPIRATDLPHIFERFYRADASRTGGEGHGLGLAIAQKLATSMGATIAVKSDETGTTFTLRLSPL